MDLNSKIIISEEVFNKSKDFAEASVQSSLDKYSRRNQFDVEKIKQDIKVGRIGEEIVYQELKKHFPEISGPDYNVYEAIDKSWDPDLKDPNSNIKFAVKTQDIRSDIEFGTSWVFQYNKNKNFDCDKEIFKEKNNSFVCFVSLNSPKRFGMIRSIVRTSWIHDNNLFKDMKLSKLIGNKMAVYYDDLQKFDGSLCQIL